MEPSSLFKVTGAFAAGVVLALGGALIYLKTNAAPAHPSRRWSYSPDANPKNPPAAIAIPSTGPAGRGQAAGGHPSRQAALPKTAVVRRRPPSSRWRKPLRLPRRWFQSSQRGRR